MRKCSWVLGWNVGVLLEAGSLERRGVVTHANEVAVADEESDYVVWVGFHPGSDNCEVFFGSTGVEKVARGMTI